MPKQQPKRKKENKEFIWHYGLIRKTHRLGKTTEHWYDLHEIYDDDGKFSWTEEPIGLHGDSVNEVMDTIGMILRDIARNPTYEIRKGKLVKRITPHHKST